MSNSNKYIVLIILSFLVNTILFGQAQNYLKLQTELSTATDSLEKVYIYHKLVNVLKHDSLDKAISINKKALKACQQS